MEREVRLLSGEVVRYRDDNPSWWLAATGGKPLGRPVSEWVRPTDRQGPKPKWPVKREERASGESPGDPASNDPSEAPYTRAQAPQNESYGEPDIDYDREPPVRPL